MKKNKTDELFARKLHRAEAEPRPEAWDKLQARLQTKQRPLVWWQQRSPWLVAAGLSLLLVAGWVIWQNQAPAPSPMAQINTPQTPTPELPQVSSTASQEKVEIKIRQSAVTEATNATQQSKSIIKKMPLQNSEPTPAATQLAQKIPALTEPKESAELPALTIAETRTPETQVAATTPKAAENTPMAEKKVIVQLPESAAAVAVNELADLPLIETAPTQDKSKNTRLSRIFRQVKNAKEGERVDWQEVGVNPKLLAKVTRNNK